MADDLTFGVALKSTSDGSMNADVKSARDDIEALKKSTEDLSVASAKMAQGSTEDWAAMQRSLNAYSIAEDNARDKAWALANGYRDVGGSMVKTAEEVAGGMDSTAFATRRAMQEMVVMGREIGRGNFSRLPGTMSIIAQGLGPVGWAVAGVTAAVAAGAYAWMEWGDSAGKAVEKAQSDLAAAEALAKKSIHLSNVDQITADMNKIRDKEIENAYIETQIQKAQDTERTASNNRKLADFIMEKSQERAANREYINNLKKDAQDRADRIKPDKTEDPNASLLSEVKRSDDQMIEYSKDAFTRRIDAWVEMQQKMTDAGIYYGKVRQDHEAAYTAFVNDEDGKRYAAAEAAAKKKSDAETLHLAQEQVQQAAYYGRIAAMAEDAGNTAQGRAKLRYDKELIDLEKNHQVMSAKVASDHVLALAEEKAYQQAKLDLKKSYDAQYFYTQTDLANAIQGFNANDHEKAITGTMGYLTKLTAINASNNKDSFEANKVFSIASATVNTYLAASEAFVKAGGGWSGAIAAAASIAYGLAQVAAIESTSYGGGRGGGPGGGIPSQGASPGVPVSVQSPYNANPQSTVGVAAGPAQQFNVTLQGIDPNNSAPQFTYDQVFNQLWPLLQQVVANGATNLNVTFQ